MLFFQSILKIGTTGPTTGHWTENWSFYLTVGLSREQSSSSEGLLLSARDVIQSDNEEESDKQKNANLEAVLDFVPCSEPDSDEGISNHDQSLLKNLEDASVNRSDRPVRAALLRVAQYLVAAREVASSRACS